MRTLPTEGSHELIRGSVKTVMHKPFSVPLSDVGERLAEQVQLRIRVR